MSRHGRVKRLCFFCSRRFRIVQGSSVQGVSGLFPGVDPALERLGTGKSFFYELFRPTGGACFPRSGTIENNFLVF